MAEHKPARLGEIERKIAALHTLGVWEPSEMASLLEEAQGFLKTHPHEAREVLSNAAAGWIQIFLDRRKNVVSILHGRTRPYPGTIHPKLWK